MALEMGDSAILNRTGPYLSGKGQYYKRSRRDYSFAPEGTQVNMTHIARMIGNAVPVKLGQAIGKSIMNHLEKHTSPAAG